MDNQTHTERMESHLGVISVCGMLGWFCKRFLNVGSSVRLSKVKSIFFIVFCHSLRFLKENVLNFGSTVFAPNQKNQNQNY